MFSDVRHKDIKTDSLRHVTVPSLSNRALLEDRNLRQYQEQDRSDLVKDSKTFSTRILSPLEK